MTTQDKHGYKYSLVVDYEKSIEDLIKEGRYAEADPDITSRNFPPKKKGVINVKVELIDFGGYILDVKALHKMEEMGYRPADIYELLTLGKKHPKLQLQFKIVALGSVLGGKYVPYLYKSSNFPWGSPTREVFLGLFLNEKTEWLPWDRIYNQSRLFAAVRK